MDIDPGINGAGSNHLKGLERTSKNVIVRSIKPTDNSDTLWRISVGAMQSADSRFTKVKNQTHEDFDRPYEFYRQKHRGDLLIAEVNGQIVGFGGFIESSESKNESTCNMRRLRVDPDYQYSGIGQKLIEEREKKAIGMGYKVAHVGTTNKNQVVLRLLQKNGYRIIEETPNPNVGLGPDCIEYQLEKILV